MISLFPSRAVAVEVFGFGVHWYGLLYLAAFVIAWYLLPRLQRFRDLGYSVDTWSNLLSWAVVGVIVGGRLGFVLFYEPQLLASPLDAIAVWRGGMSSHGGFIGVTLALFFALRHRRGDILKVADTLVVPVALGLACGRIGNFINQELYGTVTTLPWGIAVPGVDGLRHPVQLYAVAKDLLIAGVCLWHLMRPQFIAGRTFALFLMLYGVLRFLVEALRDQTYAPVDLAGLLLTRGQLMTLPVILAGVVLWLLVRPRPAA